MEKEIGLIYFQWKLVYIYIYIYVYVFLFEGKYLWCYLLTLVLIGIEERSRIGGERYLWDEDIGGRVSWNGACFLLSIVGLIQRSFRKRRRYMFFMDGYPLIYYPLNLSVNILFICINSRLIWDCFFANGPIWVSIGLG